MASQVGTIVDATDDDALRRQQAAEIIAAARANAKRTAAECATEAGMTGDWWTAIENGYRQGRRRPPVQRRLETLISMARVVGVLHEVQIALGLIPPDQPRRRFVEVYSEQERALCEAVLAHFREARQQLTDESGTNPLEGLQAS